MVSASIFPKRDKYVPRTRGRAGTRAKRDFLKAIVDWEKKGCVTFEVRNGVSFILFCDLGSYSQK
jgi:hypothetical protein